MKLAHSQKGLGLWGLLLLFGIIGFVSICVIKIGPVYLQHSAIVRAMNAVAADPDSAEKPLGSLRNALKRRFDIENITHITTKDVVLIKTNTGRKLATKYEARRNLFGNIDVVIRFEAEAPIRR